MKTTLLTLGRTAAAAILAGLLVPGLLPAADAPAAAPAARPATPAAPGAPAVAAPANPQPDRVRGGNAGGGQERRAVLSLDDQQRQVFRDALMKSRDDMARLEEQLRVAQKELVKATTGENYDEKVVREKAEAVSRIQTEMTLLRCKALAVIAPTLKPEQREEMLNGRMGVFMLTSGFMMDFGGNRGGGGMGGGFGGGGPGFGGGGQGAAGFAPGGAGFDPNSGRGNRGNRPDRQR